MARARAAPANCSADVAPPARASALVGTQLPEVTTMEAPARAEPKARRARAGARSAAAAASQVASMSSQMTAASVPWMSQTTAPGVGASQASLGSVQASQSVGLASQVAAPELWGEKHFPSSEANLVVNKKRIELVREHLATAAKRLLILKGPPGSGKAAVLRAVCADFGYDVVEWSPAMKHQPAGAVSRGDVQMDSLSDSFLRFLAQTDRYAGLEVVPSSADGTVAMTPLRRRRRVALVRDFPFTLMQAGGDKQRAEDFLERFRDAVRAGAIQRTVLCFNDGREDYHIVNRLTAQVDADAVALVTFDTVAKTFVQRALDAIVKAEGVLPSLANTSAIAAECGGDLRHAINALQLVAGGVRQQLPVEPAAKARGAKGAKKPRGGKAPPPPTPQGGTIDTVDGAASAAFSENAEATPSTAMRPAALGLFHSLGRLLYCKRIPPAPVSADNLDDGASQATPATASQPRASKRRRKNDEPEPKQLPHHLLVPKATRPPLYFVPEEVLSQSNSEPRNVVEWLFTNAPRFFGDIEDLAQFTGALANTDAWDLDHRMFHGGEAVLPPWDGLACSVQARSLLDANLHPQPPAFGDMCCTPEVDSEAKNFNMVRPLLRDVDRNRQRRREELEASLEAVGPIALGAGGASVSSLITKTLPHVHMMMARSRGSHPRLQYLPHGLMRLSMELSAFDGSILKKVSDGDTDQEASRARAGDLQNWTPPTQSWTALEDDPIED